MKSEKYFFKGFVFYYGKHYFCYFRNLNDANWYLYDDAKVKIVGEWSDVINACVKGRSLPTLLFYEKLDNDEEVYLAETLHFMNELLSKRTFQNMRYDARTMDKDI